MTQLDLMSRRVAFRFRVKQAGGKEYAAEVAQVGPATVTLKGSGHAALKAGLTVPKKLLPRGVKRGDEFWAVWKPGRGVGDWSFSPLDFKMASYSADEFFQNNGWEVLEGAAKAKAERVTGENRLDYAKRFGRKTVFLRDSGVLRLRAIGPSGEVYQMKLFSSNGLEKAARELALAAATGEPQKGMYVHKMASRDDSQGEME
jgi:hypothetical protein